MATITREEARRRWNNVFRQKREAVARETKRLIEEYEREFGEKPKYVEVW